jgi:PAS domain S-box-containing protein
MEFKRLAEEGWKALFHALFEHSTEALFVLDSAGRILDLNRLASDSLGRSREELIGRCPVEFDTSWQQALPQGVHASPGCSTVSFRTTHRRKDGTEFPVDARVVPVGHEGQRLALFFARNLSEHRATTKAHLTLSNFELARMNRAMHAGQQLEEIAGEVLEAVVEIFACDRAWLIHLCDPQVTTWRAVVERTRPHCPAVFDPGAQSATDPPMAAVFAAAMSSSQPVLLLPPALAERFGARAQMALALRPKGAQPYLLGLHQCSHARTWTEDEQRLFRDIGDRLTDALTGVLAFSRLTDSERRLEAAQRIAAVGWWERDFLTGQVSLSDQSCRIFGVHPLNMPQWHDRWLSLIHPEDRAQAGAAVQAALAGGPRYDVEYRIIRPDGVLRVVHSQGDVIRDESGRPILQFGVMQDITRLRQAEQAMRESEQRYRTLFEKARDAFFLLDEQHIVVDVNQQACDALGYSREELIGMRSSQFDAKLDERSIELVAARARAGETVTFETLHRRRDGSVFPVEIRSGTFKRGEQMLYLALARDISDRKLAEETVRAKDQALQAVRAELARVSRVMTLGELTASIAHEVNQPLAAMVTNAAATMRWLAADPPQTEKARRALQSIADDGRRAGEVILRIRALVQRRPARMSPVSANDVIADVIALAQQELRSNGVVLSRLLSEDLPCVLGDRIQLQQVLLNLVVNAIEAMGTVKDRPRELTIASRLDEPDGVLVEVRDTGPGLEREHADHLFEAFYTTKSEGLGIGLSISRSIVEAHGGRLSAAQNVPHGAIFRFTLPVQGDASA